MLQNMFVFVTVRFGFVRQDLPQQGAFCALWFFMRRDSCRTRNRKAVRVFRSFSESPSRRVTRQSAPPPVRLVILAGFGAFALADGFGLRVYG